VKVNLGAEYALYKKPSFKDEKEWRIICLSSSQCGIRHNFIKGIKLSDVKHRVSRGKIVSHTEMNFENARRDLIKEVWIGPKSKVTKTDVLKLLLINGYYESNDEESEGYNFNKPILIETSASTYRWQLLVWTRFGRAYTSETVAYAK
jgi:hypothetical protein